MDLTIFLLGRLRKVTIKKCFQLFREVSHSTRGSMASRKSFTAVLLEMPSTMESLLGEIQITKSPFCRGPYDHGGPRLYEGPISPTAGTTLAKSWIRLWALGEWPRPPLGSAYNALNCFGRRSMKNRFFTCLTSL